MRSKEMTGKRCIAQSLKLKHKLRFED